MKIIITLAILAATLSVVGYKFMSKGKLSEFQQRIADGPMILEDIIELVRKDEGKTNSTFHFSTYKPGDILYEPVLAIQQGRAYDAMEKLTELGNQGNADAMYWQAAVSYQSSAFSGPQSAELFQRSAKLGNPYAALMLDSKNRKCQKRMPSYCDEKWGILAQKLLKQRTEYGDMEAAYTLFPRAENATQNDYIKLRKIAIKGYVNGYSQPLADLIQEYLIQNENPDKYPNSKLTPIEVDVIKSIQLKLANNHHSETISYVILNDMEIYYHEEIMKVINNNLKTMGNSSHQIIKYLSSNKNITREELIKGAAYAKVSDTYQAYLSENQYFSLYEYFMSDSYKPPFTNEELTKINELSTIFKNESTPVIHITMRCTGVDTFCIDFYIDE